MTTQAEDRAIEIRAGLMLHQPFFASILLDKLKLHVGTFDFLPSKTMATDGKNVYMDQDFLMSLDIKEAMFVLCHEIGHCILMHMSRAKAYQATGFDGKPFNPMLWNFAGDYIINDMLVEGGIGKMPSAGLLDAKYPHTMTCDEVYRKLVDEQEQKQQSQSGGDEGGDGQTGNGSPGSPDADGRQTLDDHLHKTTEEASGASEDEDRADWQRAVAAARDVAKAQGKLPASLEVLVDQLLDPKIDWSQHLRKSVQRAAGNDLNDWSRFNKRRLVTQGIIMPRRKGFSAGHVIVIVDTSGSMSLDEINVALTETDSILLDCNPERIHLIYCDADCTDEHVTELNPGETLRGNIPTIRGRGGTSFVPPFKYINDMGWKPATVIYFTDMMGRFPEAQDYPVIWCNTNADDREAPFGETIPVDLREYR